MQGYDYSQNDPRWRDELLGFSTFFHMGTWAGRHDVAAGCYVTALAMAASYLGHPCNPSEMNAKLKAAGLIDGNGDITANGTLNRLFDDIEFVGRADWPTQPAPLDQFDIINDVDTEIIVLIDSQPAAGLQQHWLRVRGWDKKGDILVVDPWDGKRKGLSAYAAIDGKPVERIIYAAVRFHKKVSAPAPPPSPAPAPAPPAPAPSTVVVPDSPAPINTPSTVPPVETPSPVVLQPTAPQPVAPPPLATPIPRPSSENPTNTDGVNTPRVITPIPTPSPEPPGDQPANDEAARGALSFLVQLLRMLLCNLGIKRRR